MSNQEASPTPSAFSELAYIAQLDEKTREATLADGPERVERLQEIAREVAQVAREQLETEPIYELREKGAVRKFMNNREQTDLVEATEGWVVVPPSSSVVSRPAGRANLTNGAFGLILTTDGRLYGAIAKKGMRPVGERFETIDRTDIDRKPFIPQERNAWYHPPISKKTLAPRYRPFTDGLPTILGDLNDPDGGFNTDYFTPYVVGQCYHALANFLDENKLWPAPEEPTEPTLVRDPDEPPTELIDTGKPQTDDLEALPEQPELKEVEALSDQEKIDQWLNEGLVTLHTWFGQHNLDKKHGAEQGENRYMTVYNERSKAAKLGGVIKKARTPETTRKTLSRQGIGELVTIMKVGKKFGDVDPSSQKADEEMVLTTYEIPDSGKGSSGETVMNVFLPESDATELLDMIYNNPAMIRELTRRFVDDHLDVKKSWDQARPDYERLRARQMDHKSLVVFRRSFADQPKFGSVREVRGTSS